jgi:hypothetical protein
VALKKVELRNTAPGVDRIRWERISRMPRPALLIFVQACIGDCQLPANELITGIIPIRKKTTVPSDASTYLGITLESYLLKLLVILISIMRRFDEWAERGKSVSKPL